MATSNEATWIGDGRGGHPGSTCLRQVAPVEQAWSAVERRYSPRFKVDLTGVCSVGGGIDVACTTVDMSVEGLALRCEATASIGVTVIALLPQVGLLRGSIVRATPDGFALFFHEGRSQRQRVTNYLICVVERGGGLGLEHREHLRIVPLQRVVSLEVSGVVSTARILDISRSGVALTTTRGVEVGGEVVVGRTPVIVVRILPGGFAARFNEPLGPTFDAFVVL